MKKALILVDLQNDFFPGGALGVKNAHEILLNINHLLMQKWDAIVATKDWHPPNHLSFAVNHGKEVGDVIVVNGTEQILWPIHCVQGAQGAEFAPGWNSNLVQKIFYKGTDPSIDSYSTFFDNDHHVSTGLDNFLKENGITDLYFAGLTTEYCVKYSVLDAIELGYKAHVYPKACRGVNLTPDDEAEALKVMEKAGAELIHNGL